jgi:hypothetical protein
LSLTLQGDFAHRRSDDKADGRAWLSGRARPSEGQLSHITRRINITRFAFYRVPRKHTGSAMISEDLRRKNASLHDRIEQVLEMHPELRDGTEGIALRQDLHVQVGAPFLERTRDKLQSERERLSNVALS